MAGINKVFVLGNLGRDPELRYTNGGSAVVTLSVATSRKWKKKDGQTQEETEWHKVTVWGKQAEHCNNYLAKGRQVHIEGRLRTSKYTDKDGVEKYSTEIVAEQVTFVGGRGEGGGGQGGGSAPYDGGSYTPGPEGVDDDIPF